MNGIHIWIATIVLYGAFIVCKSDCPNGYVKPKFWSALKCPSCQQSTNEDFGGGIFSGKALTFRSPARFVLTRKQRSAVLFLSSFKAYSDGAKTLEVKIIARKTTTYQVAFRRKVASLKIGKGIGNVKTIEIKVIGKLRQVTIKKIDIEICKKSSSGADGGGSGSGDISNLPCTKLSSPCNNRGFCTTTSNGHKCDCFRGWGGNECETNEDDCIHERCVHGECVDGLAMYSCKCEIGWIGQYCDAINTNDPRCPSGHAREDVNYAHSSMFSVTITPNKNDQDPKMGLIGASRAGAEGYLKLADDDKITIQLKPGNGDIYIGQICLKTFVVDTVIMRIYYAGQSTPVVIKEDPVMGSEWFRNVCTKKILSGKFKKMNKVEFSFTHQPPNFNVKDIFIEACMRK